MARPEAVGVSPKVVSEQLGHASTAFTFDTYAHVLPHMQDEAAAKVEAMLFRQTAWRMLRTKSFGTRYDHGAVTKYSGAEF